MKRLSISAQFNRAPLISVQEELKICIFYLQVHSYRIHLSQFISVTFSPHSRKTILQAVSTNQFNKLKHIGKCVTKKQ